MTSKKENYCIAMQPICNAKMEHIADELLYRTAVNAQGVFVDDNELATARVCNIAFYETGIKNLVDNRNLFINMPTEWLLKPELLPPNSEQIVIEVLENVIGSKEVIDSLKIIKQKGYTIALDDFVLNSQTMPLLDIADIIKVDLFNPINMQHIDLYKSKGIKLLAEKVEDYDTFIEMRDLGFEMFQGYFYAKPETHKATSRNRSNNHMALLRLISEIQHENTNLRQLQDIIAQDLELTFLLLKYANSAMYNRSGSIETISQAINSLGLNRIRTIAMTIMMAKNGPASRLMLGQALTRAAMCQELYTIKGSNGDVAFTVGLVSMMDSILGEPLEALIKNSTVSNEIIEIVIERKHVLGELLSNIEKFENAEILDWNNEQVEKYNDSWLKSQVWATNTLASINVCSIK